jgi:hypothetical protein
VAADWLSRRNGEGAGIPPLGTAHLRNGVMLHLCQARSTMPANERGIKDALAILRHDAPQKKRIAL